MKCTYKMFRTKLLTATPEEARRGMNSVSIVVDMAKISMLPIPKKKLAKSYRETLVADSHRRQIRDRVAVLNLNKRGRTVIDIVSGADKNRLEEQ